MLTSKKMTLKPILEYESGIHLTAYLVNRGDLIDLKSQLKTVLKEASEWLSSALSTEDRKKFLEPLDALLFDARIFKRMKGNIGIFRTLDSFRVQELSRHLKYKNTVRTAAANSLSRPLVNDICVSVRKIVKAESQRSLEKALIEFRFSEEGLSLEKTDAFQGKGLEGSSR